MRSVDSALELLGFTDLEAIQYYELSARLRIGFPDDQQSDSAHDQAGATEKLPEQDWHFFIQKNSDQINFRARLAVHSHDANYVVDAAAFYSLREPLSVSEEILQEFINRAAMISVYPYIREALHEQARKIGADLPVLGIYNPGDIAVDLSTADKRQALTED